MPSPKYCWDACVFIAYLTGEPRAQGEVDGLFEVLDLVDRHQAVILTSTLVRTEVLDDPAHPDLATRLEGLFASPSCVAIETNRAISEKAGRLRTACRAAGRSLKTPDALYLATALLNGATAFHTFDGQLLGLSGLHEVDLLTICKPSGPQTLLGL